MNHIKLLANHLVELYEIMYKQVEPEVRRIIDCNIKEEPVINACLDQMLNIPTDKGWKLLKELIAYYQKFNSEVANEYLETYMDMYDIKPKTKKRT